MLRDSSHPHHVVIVGAGFRGLEVAHRLAGAPVRITLIDQRNHHLALRPFKGKKNPPANFGGVL